MPAPPPFPRRINVEVTNHCDQRCRLCPRTAFTRPLGFLDVGLFRKIAAECARYDTVLWLHFLGEPLLHPDLPRMVRDAKALGARQVGVSTNGVSLEGDLADALLDCGLDRLECSLDADDRDAYLAMRGRDHYDRVTRNVREFLRRKRERALRRPVTSIQFMRTPEVEASLRSLVDAWRPHLGPDDFVMTIVPAAFAGAVAAGPFPAPARRPPCPWLSSALVVLQDGTVTMCGADWDARAPLGNVRERSLRELWEGETLQRRRRLHLEGRFAELDPCATCSDWRLADGSGYANALAEVDAEAPLA